MKLTATLLFLFLLAAPAFPADVSSENLAEVCQQTYPQDQEAAADCVVKTAGQDSQTSLSDRDIYIEIVGQAPDAEAARQTSLGSNLEKALHVLIEACQSASDLEACLLENLDKERAQLSRYLDALESALWWDDDVRFALFHIMLKTAEGKNRCESLDPSAQPACVEQLPMIMSHATEEALQDLSDKRRYRASYHATLGNLEIENRLEAQREQDKELFRVEADTRRLQGFALRGGALSLSNRLYAGQSKPIVPSPFYEPFPRSMLSPGGTIASSPVVPLLPPVSCTPRSVGGTVYTDCY